MKSLKNILIKITESSFDKWYNIQDDVKTEFRALASCADEDEYKTKTYEFMCDILKCFDVSETYLKKNIDNNILKEIKDLRYKIRNQYL